MNRTLGLRSTGTSDWSFYEWSMHRCSRTCLLYEETLFLVSWHHVFDTWVVVGAVEWTCSGSSDADDHTAVFTGPSSSGAASCLGEECQRLWEPVFGSEYGRLGICWAVVRSDCRTALDSERSYLERFVFDSKCGWLSSSEATVRPCCGPTLVSEHGCLG